MLHCDHHYSKFRSKLIHRCVLLFFSSDVLPWDSNCSTASFRASSAAISNSSMFSLTAASNVSWVILRFAMLHWWSTFWNNIIMLTDFNESQTASTISESQHIWSHNALLLFSYERGNVPAVFADWECIIVTFFKCQWTISNKENNKKASLNCYHRPVTNTLDYEWLFFVFNYYFLKLRPLESLLPPTVYSDITASTNGTLYSWFLPDWNNIFEIGVFITTAKSLHVYPCIHH